MAEGLLVAALAILMQVLCAEALGCFKCTSRNHDTPDCEDTFMNNPNNAYYESDCMATVGTRNGLFIATQCIKIVIDDEEHGRHLLFRDCVVDNGGLSSETEIGRIAHCSNMGTTVELDGIKSKGCVEICDTDGCNRGHTVRDSSLGILSAVMLTGFFVKGILL